MATKTKTKNNLAWAKVTINVHVTLVSPRPTLNVIKY